MAEDDGLEIFYAMDDGEISPEPATLAELLARAEAGLVRSETLVWSDGILESWAPVGDCATAFPELVETVARVQRAASSASADVDSGDSSEEEDAAQSPAQRARSEPAPDGVAQAVEDAVDASGSPVVLHATGYTLQHGPTGGLLAVSTGKAVSNVICMPSCVPPPAEAVWTVERGTDDGYFLLRNKATQGYIGVEDDWLSAAGGKAIKCSRRDKGQAETQWAFEQQLVNRVALWSRSAAQCLVPTTSSSARHLALSDDSLGAEWRLCAVPAAPAAAGLEPEPEPQVSRAGAVTDGSPPSTATDIAPGSQLHVRGVGVYGWDGSAEGKGLYESDKALGRLFAPFGTFVQATVRHRVDATSGENTSWALVTMADKTSAERAVLAAAHSTGPGIFAGDGCRLVVTRFSKSVADSSTGAMGAVRTEDRKKKKKKSRAEFLKDHPELAIAGSTGTGGASERLSSPGQGTAKKRKKKKKAGEEPGSTLHVRGVAAGPQAEATLTRIFSGFGAVVQVTIRERYDKTTGADTSWALVTMASKQAAELAIEEGVEERMDPGRAITLAEFSQKQASQSTGGMVQARKQAAAKVIQSKWRQRAAWQETMMMSFEFGLSSNDEEDGEDEQGPGDGDDEAATQAAAATHIQALHRGNLERANQQAQTQAAIAIQARQRGKAQRMERREQEAAAVRIQARQRGKQGQRQVRVRKRVEKNRAMETKKAQQAEAAVRIQAIQRGKQGRTKSRTQKAEQMAIKKQELAVAWEEQQRARKLEEQEATEAALHQQAEQLLGHPLSDDEEGVPPELAEPIDVATALSGEDDEAGARVLEEAVEYLQRTGSAEVASALVQNLKTVMTAAREKALEAEHAKASREKITVDAADKARRASSLHQQKLTQTEAEAYRLHEETQRRHAMELQAEREASRRNLSALEDTLSLMQNTQKELTMSRVLRRMKTMTMRFAYRRWHDQVHKSLLAAEARDKTRAAEAAQAEGQKVVEMQTAHEQAIAESHRRHAEEEEAVQAEHARQLVAEAIAAREETQNLLQGEIERLVQEHMRELSDVQRTISEQQYGTGSYAPYERGLVSVVPARRTGSGSPPSRQGFALQPASSYASADHGDEPTLGSSSRRTGSGGSWQEPDASVERGHSRHILKDTRILPAFVNG